MLEGFLFLLKRKRWKKNCCGKWFPINETHCAMVYTAMWTNDRVPIRNWRRPLLFASFCFPTECFLVYSSDTLTLPFTEIWFDSRRNWVPMGGPETPPPTMSYISIHLPGLDGCLANLLGAQGAATALEIFWVCASIPIWAFAYKSITTSPMTSPILNSAQTKNGGKRI